MKNPFKNPEFKRYLKKALKKRDVLPREVQATYYHYKEPMRKFEKGFGYHGALAQNKEKTHVQCHFCGYFFRSVSAHVKAHGLTVAQYKEKTGLMQKTALIGEKTRLRRIEIFNELPKDVRDRMRHQIKEKRKPYNNPKGRNGQGTAEQDNILGRCPDQLLDHIRKLAKKLGKTPTQREFRVHYKGQFIGSIYRVYGTWGNALKFLGYQQRKGGKKEIPKEVLLQYLRNFYENEGRTPSSSDFRRGLLPGESTYQRHFGTLKKARDLAGVPNPYLGRKV